MERVHVNYFADRLGVIVARRITHVALQFRVGVLPEWRSRSGSCDCAHFGLDGSSLAQRITRNLMGSLSPKQSWKHTEVRFG